MVDLVRQDKLSTLPRENPFPVVCCASSGAIDFCNPATEQLAAEWGFDAVSGLLPEAHVDLVAACLQGSPGLSATVTVGGRTIRWAYRAAIEFNIVNLYGQELSAATSDQGAVASLPRANPNPVISCDLHGKIHFSNPAAGYLVRAVGLKSEAELLPRGHLQLVRSSLEGAESIAVRSTYGKRIFEWVYRSDREDSVVNIYGHEITEHAAEVSAFAATLDSVPTGVIVVDADLKVIFINRSAQHIISQDGGLTIDKGRLSTPAPTDLSGTGLRVIDRLRHLVAKTIAQVDYRDASGEVLVVPRMAGQAPLELLVAPLNNQLGGEQLVAGTAMLFLCNPNPLASGAEDILRSLYNLTPTEAKIASLLAAGASLKEVSSALGTSIGTVRVHLHKIFTKTGTHRQATLVQRIHAGPAGIALQRR